MSCRSRSGFLTCVNTTLVQWLSKKQSMVETTVFGNQFVTMKEGIDAFRSLRHKLQKVGIQIFYPSYIYEYNMSVAHNTSRPKSELRKYNNSVSCHAVRESVTMGESLVGQIPSKENVTDLILRE